MVVAESWNLRGGPVFHNVPCFNFFLFFFPCRCLWLTESRWHWWWIWMMWQRRTQNWWRAFVRTPSDTLHCFLILCMSSCLSTESTRYTHTRVRTHKAVLLKVPQVTWLTDWLCLRVHILPFNFRWWLKMRLMFISNTAWWWREEVVTLRTRVIPGTSTPLSSWEDCEWCKVPV